MDSADVVNNIAMVAAAKEELARQLFFRLVRMGVQAGLFRADEQVTFERGMLAIDAYLGIPNGDAPDAHEMKVC